MVAANNLRNFRPVSSDEMWIMSASYKLATEGVFGSDIYAGFWNADHHYFIALPVHHFLQALGFLIGGVGVAQARWVSLGGAVVVIWAACWLAYRWYGVEVSALTGVLLILWRSNLISTWPGLPLLTVARSGRYDVGGVAWVCLSIVCLDRTLRHRHWFSALATGLCAGLATLTQFFGAFVLPLIGIAWLWHHGWRAVKKLELTWIAVGVLVILGSYVVYGAHYPEDMAGQIVFTKGGRFQLGRPAFYLDNVRREIERFAVVSQRPAMTLKTAQAFDRPAGPWLLAVGIWPAFACLVYRVARDRAVGDRLLLLSLVVPGGLLALVEQTKAPLYGIVLLPAVCVALAMFVGEIASWVRNASYLFPARLILGGTGVVFLSVVIAEGVSAYQVDLAQAAEVSDYLEVGRQIDTYLVPSAPVLGSDRWWWALHDHPYLAFNALRAQWLTAEQAGGQSLHFGDQVRRTQSEFLIVGKDVLGSVDLAPPEFRSQFWNFLNRCTGRVGNWADATYGEIQIHQVDPGCLGETRRAGALRYGSSGP